MKAIYIADFLENYTSIAYRRQKRMLDALEKFYTVEIITRKIDGNKEIKKRKNYFQIFKKIKWLEKYRLKWGVLRSHRFPDGAELFYFRSAISIKDAPDIVVISFGPFSTLLCGFILKIRFPDTKIWIDYRDLYYNNPNYVGLPIIRVFEKLFNRYINKIANVVSTVSMGLAEDLPSVIRPIVVYNDADRAEKSERTQPVFNNHIVMAYFGTYYKYYDAVGLVNYLRQFNCIEKKVILAGDCSALYAILNSAKLEKINIEYLGFITKDEIKSLRLARPREIYFSSGHMARGILSGKIFEYIENETTLYVSGKILDEEVARLLCKIKNIEYDQNSYCVLNLNSKFNGIFYNDFDELIYEAIL